MKRVLLLSAVVFLAFSATACQNNNKNYGNNGYSQSSNSDRSISDQIHTFLNNAYNLSQDAKNISVSTNNGTVTLKGRVANQNEMNIIVNYIQQLPGVNNVNSQLEIRRY